MRRSAFYVAFGVAVGILARYTPLAPVLKIGLIDAAVVGIPVALISISVFDLRAVRRFFTRKPSRPSRGGITFVPGLAVVSLVRRHLSGDGSNNGAS
ncbi:MAG TPA: hypothetical protein VF169_19005 [Albitalea sp.]|uniref:hypothetical protein n=1 Tax=Piscinibacter sp. TaxID=1903157 RepID=UPI002ED08168